jgi:hypothetical protein
MKIACLGWGSLIWRQENLQIQNKWFEDGPILPIEFSRHSDNDRLTLIIDEEAKPVRVLWALMTSDNIQLAIQSLKEREGIKKDDLIHSAKATDTDKSAVKSTIIQWLKSKDIDAAIWTGLSFSDKTNKNRPTLEYVLNHLRTLEYIKRRTAEEYIRKAPKQIDTEFRRKIEVEFGWTPIE